MTWEAGVVVLVIGVSLVGFWHWQERKHYGNRQPFRNLWRTWRRLWHFDDWWRGGGRDV